MSHVFRFFCNLFFFLHFCVFFDLCHYVENIFHLTARERGGSVVKRRTPERDMGGGGRNLPPPCCVIEQETLLPKSTGYTQEAVVPSQHD